MPELEGAFLQSKIWNNLEWMRWLQETRAYAEQHQHNPKEEMLFLLQRIKAYSRFKHNPRTWVQQQENSKH